MEQRKKDVERWRSIPGASGYQVSSLGRLRSIDRYTPVNGGVRFSKGRVLKPYSPKGKADQYPRYTLQMDTGEQQWVKIHIVVCSVFNGPRPSSRHWCLHRDDDVFNNTPANLYWGTPKQNGEDCRRNNPHNAKATDAIIAAIQAEFAAGVGRRELTDKYKMNRATIYRITVSGRAW